MMYLWGFLIASVSASFGYILGAIMTHASMMDEYRDDRCIHGLPREYCPNCRPS